MQVDSRPATINAEVPSSGLWGTQNPNGPSSSPKTSTSTLFGSTLSPTPSSPSTTISAPKSSLFGDVLLTSTTRDPAFQALVSKINSTLVIAPSVPGVIAAAR